MSDYIQLASICGSQVKYIQVANVSGNHIQLANLRGHKEDHKPNMVKDDFYTLCMKDPKDNIGLRKEGMIIFNKNDTNIYYLCSDLARFCLSIYKNNQHNDGGNMSMVPKQPIPISEELSEYIRDFLPDYYGIRDNVK
jgi:hypothetical protein